MRSIPALAPLVVGLVTTALSVGLVGCASTAETVAAPVDHEWWGYSRDNPIGVKDLGWSQDALNETYYLNLLRGPEGQEVHYRLIGECCAVDSEGKPSRRGTLHRYKVHYQGLGNYVILYFDPKGRDELQPPKGFALTD